MKCPFCSSEDTKVVDSRTTIDGSTKRRRECNNCLKRFSTYERFEESPIYVVKKDNRRVKYEREKLLRGLTFATAKRNVSREQLDKIITDIERGLQNSLVSEISSKELGEKVLEKLRELDQVAYVRFASVYKEFNDIKSFIEIVEEIKKDLETSRNDFHIAVENFQHDFNIGTIARNANAFNAAGIHIIGKKH